MKEAIIERERKPSLLRANLLYLISMLLIVGIGSRLQSIHAAWGVVATEVLLILIPTLLFTRWEDLSWRETLRLRWPGWTPALLGLLIGAGLWPLSLVIESVTNLMFGYQTPPLPGLSPVTWWQVPALVLALAVAAPLCEEAMFRGYIQRAYEGRSAAASIVATWLLFALFHLRFRGLLALLPISLALSYLAWRTDSLVPGILAHFATNGSQVALATGTALLGWDLATMQAFARLGTLLTAGLAVAGLGIWWLQRHTTPLRIASQPVRSAWFVWLWPVVAALAIFAYAAHQEVMFARFPEQVTPPLALQAPPWDRTYTLQYVIQDRQGSEVGQATCTLQPVAGAFELSCQQQNEAFDLRIGSSRYVSGRIDRAFQAVWDATSLDTLTLSITSDINDNRLRVLGQTGSGDFVLAQRWNEEITHTVTLSPQALVEPLWPWRLSGVTFRSGVMGRVTVVLPGPGEVVAVPAVVWVDGPERTVTPAGVYTTWRVRLERRTAFGPQVRTAWYDMQPPHVLVRYDDGVLNYLLHTQR